MNPIYPGAVQIGGAFRGYVIGRIPNLTTAIRHQTIGVNSIGTCGRDFQLLQARDGVLYQGAEVDSVNYGAGMPWNWNSVHVEAEWHPTYNDGEPVLNDAMIASLAGFAAWLESEWGIRRDASYHGYGGRLTEWAGWIDHCWLIQTGDWHYNSWPIEEWQRVAAGGTPASTKEFEMSWLIHEVPTGKVWVFNLDTHTKTWLRSPDALSAQINARNITNMFHPGSIDANLYRTDQNDGLWANLLVDARDTDTFAAVTPPGAGGAGAVPLTVTLTGTATPA